MNKTGWYFLSGVVLLLLATGYGWIVQSSAQENSSNPIVSLNPSPFAIHQGSSTEMEEKAQAAKGKGGGSKGRKAGAEETSWAWLVSQMRDLGVEWARVDFEWEAIEKTEGNYDWSLPDRIIQEAQKAGLNLLVQIRHYALTSLYSSDPQKKLTAYENFIRQLVRRYKGKVQYWQIENEVTAKHNGFTSLDQYVQILQVAYRTIKGEDSTAKVLLAGFGSSMTEQVLLQPASKKASESVSEIKTLLDKARNSYDILDLHFYHNPDTIVQKIDLYRKQMQALGYQKPIWATEMGGPDQRYYTKQLGQTPPADVQPAEVVKRYVVALANGVERVFWHKLYARQTSKSVGNPELILGTQRKPAFSTYQLMVRKLKGATTVQRLDLGQDVFAYRFTKPSGDVYVLWSKTDLQVDLRAATNHPSGFTQDRVQVTDLSGKVSQQDPAQLSLNRKPIFLEVIFEIADCGLRIADCRLPIADCRNEK